MDDESLAMIDEYDPCRDSLDHCSLLWFELGVEGVDAVPPEGYTDEQLDVASKSYERGRCQRDYLELIRLECAQEYEKRMQELDARPYPGPEPF